MLHEETILYASHHQFYVADSDMRGDTSDVNFWTESASLNRIAVVDGVLGVGTGSCDMVRVRVEVHQEKPPLDLSAWDHVTEAGLLMKSRIMLVFGCLSDSGIFFRVEPDHYRVRCCHATLIAAVDSKGNAGDWYLVQIWPDPCRETEVLKQRSIPPAS
jgi:hypothetical protein